MSPLSLVLQWWTPLRYEASVTGFTDISVVVVICAVVECNRVDETSACVVLVDSFVSLTVDAVAVPNAVVGNADVILADGAVFPLVVSTNNVGASAEDSVVLDVSSSCCIYFTYFS